MNTQPSLLTFVDLTSCPTGAAIYDDLPLSPNFAAKLSSARIFALSIFFSALFTSIAILYVEIVYRGSRYLYFAGRLRRYYPLTSNRELKRNFMGAAAFISPQVFLYFYIFHDPNNPLSWDVRPLEIVASAAIYMIMHDQWFYWIHRHSHHNKAAYERLHKLHHEYTHEMNHFMTAYGEIAENFLDVGCGWLVQTTLVCLTTRNAWDLLFPYTFATLTTILGHGGYAMSPWFAIFHPLMIPLKLIAPYMLTPNDHQNHHLLRRCNYGLFFRFNDKLYGTYKKSTAKSYDVNFWAQKVKNGEEMRGKMDRDFKKRIPVGYEETSFNEVTTPWWEELVVPWGF
ncbi:hypothetical protein T439DRAFT_351910 [Meredithblackwellia eburnea MCA 4105]